jgi:hypothetical protein
MGDVQVLCVADQLENGDSIMKPFHVVAPVINVDYTQYPHHVRVDFADHSTMWLKPHMELVVERLS